MKKTLFGIAAVLSAIAITACGPTTTDSTPGVDPSVDPTSNEPSTTGPVFVPPEAISLIGTIGDGNDWLTDYDLETTDGGHTWLISNFEMNQGEEWKIRKNHDWGDVGVDNWGYSYLDETSSTLFTGTDNIVVSKSGLYTIGFNYDDAKITAELVDEYYSMSITSETTNVYVSKTLSLGVTYTKEDVADDISWTSSDDTVATVNSEGVITGIKPGTVTVTATNVSNSKVTPATIEITVKDVVVNTNDVDSYTDVSGVYSDTPKIIFTQNSGNGFPANETFSQVEFNVEPSQSYYAKARFSQSEATKWVWSRVGLVNKEVGNSFSRGLYFSRADNNNKMILTENPNGWGATTDRNQYWNFLAEHDYGNMVLELLRDGNNFYYWINGQLICSESVNNVFEAKNTVPAISFVDSNGYVTEMFATTDATLVAEQKAKVPANGYGFWGSYEENVVVDNVAGTIEFKNNNNGWPFDNIKDNAAFSIGDMGHIPANTSAKYEFDVEFTDFGQDPDSAYLALSFKPYNNPNDGIRTLMVNKYRNGVNGWGWNGGCSNALNESTDFENPIALNEVVHVTITRDVTRGWVQNVKGVEKVWAWDEVGTEFLPLFQAYRCNVKVTNITFTIL